MEDKYGYLKVVAMFYEMGNWDEETVIKKVESYAKDNHIDEKEIEDFLSRLIKKKERTIEEKKSFLGAIKFKNGELKYGAAVEVMSDDLIEKYYDIESKALGKSATDKIHDEISNHSVENNKEEKNEEPIKEDGSYSIKGGERTVIDSVSSTPKQEEAQATTSAPKQEGPQTTSSAPKAEPTTEEDYQNVERNIHAAEEDSNVRHVEASPERIEKLKKGKTRAKQFFLKAGVVVLTFALTSGLSIPLIGGYLVLSHQIKKGTYKIPGKAGEVIKKTVEGIMDLGLTAEEKEEAREERGKSR